MGPRSRAGPLLGAALICLALAIAPPGGGGGGHTTDAPACRTDSEDSDGFDLLGAGQCVDYEGVYQGFCLRYEYRDLCMGSWLYEYLAEGGACGGAWVDCASLDYSLCHGGDLYRVTHACAIAPEGGRCLAAAPRLVEACAPFACAAGGCLRACSRGTDCSPPYRCVGGACKAGCGIHDSGAWLDDDGDGEHEGRCCNRVAVAATLRGTYIVEGFTEAPPLPLADTEVELAFLRPGGNDPLETVETVTDGEGRLQFEPALCLAPGTYLLGISLPRLGTSSLRTLTVVPEGESLRLLLSPV